MLEDLQMTLDLIYSVFCMMLFIIQRVWAKACYEYHVFALIWILTIDMGSTSSMAHTPWPYSTVEKCEQLTEYALSKVAADRVLRAHILSTIHIFPQWSMAPT
jgi:hypothetical protein